MSWSDKYKKSINCDNPKGFSQRAHCQGRKKKMKEAKDHEVSMAQSQLDKTIDNAKKLKKKLGTKEKNIPAWVQAKVTDTDHNMDAAASYSEEKGGRVKKIVKQLRKSVEMHKSQADYLDKLDEEGLRDWFGKSKSKDGKKGWVNVVTGDSCASDKPGEGVPKCVSSAKRASMSKKERLAAAAAKRREDPGQQQKSGASKPTMVKTDRKVRSEEVEVNEAKDKKGKGSGTKDACYHKVKSRYSVWPSAYASGALVKCRKKGAANWGNSTKKEGMEEFYNLPELTEMQIKILQNQGYDVEIVDEACWKGYEKKGMKTMFGKRYPNCVKKEETEVEEGFLTKKSPEEIEKAKKLKAVKDREKKIRTYASLMKYAKDKHSDVAVKKEEVELEEGLRVPSQYGNVYIVTFMWRGKYNYLKMFFPQPSKPTRAEVKAAVDKVYPGSRISAYTETAVGQGDSYFNAGTEGGDTYAKFGEEVEVDEAIVMTGDQYNKMVSKRQIQDKKRSRREADANTSTDNGQMEEVQIEEGKTPAWQRKEGKNPEGGLNKAGVASYRRANPGSKLQTAVTTKPSKLKKGSKAANRRKSFCARMKGMKKRLTSAKTARDPDSRINKSLRKWNC